MSEAIAQIIVDMSGVIANEVKTLVINNPDDSKKKTGRHFARNLSNL